MREYPKTGRAVDILEAAGFMVNRPIFLQAVARHRSLSSTWNPAAKLMSPTDLEERFDEHVADSLSLAPYVLPRLHSHAVYVDVGSGAGFPAIPIALLAPNAKILLVERSIKKSAFLTQLRRLFKLADTQVRNTQIEAMPVLREATVYTARAVEQTVAIDRIIAKRMRMGDLFVAQRADRPFASTPGYHIAEVDDAFTSSGLRRCGIYLVSRLQDNSPPLSSTWNQADTAEQSP